MNSLNTSQFFFIQNTYKIFQRNIRMFTFQWHIGADLYKNIQTSSYGNASTHLNQLADVWYRKRQKISSAISANGELAI